MSGAVEKLLKPLLGKAEKWPGWTWLALIVYLAEKQLPDRVSFNGFEYDISNRWSVVIVPGVTLILYVIGDFLNDLVWKRRGKSGDYEDRFPDKLDEATKPGRFIGALWWTLGITKGIERASEARSNARRWLEVEKGSYSVALGIAEAAGGELKRGVHWPNELAKTLRSLVVPLVVAGIVMAIVKSSWWYALISLFGLVCFRMYIGLKFRHIRKLYEAVNALEKKGKITISAVPTKDGKEHRTFLVGTKTVSAVVPSKAKNDSSKGTDGSNAPQVRSSDATLPSTMGERRTEHHVGDSK